MTKGDRLRDLQVGEPRHDRVGVLLGLGQQCFFQCGQGDQEVIDRGPYPETNVGRHLIIAATCRVQPFAGITDHVSESFLDVQVNVFQSQ